MSFVFFVQETPVTEIPMEQANNDEQLIDCLQAIRGELPGFVVRAAQAGSHRELVDRVCGLLVSATGITYKEDHELYKTDVALDNLATQIGNGVLHEDAEEEYEEYINIHSTNSGLGRVMLANCGPEVRNLKRGERGDMMRVPMNNWLNRGVVDANAMSPVIHTTVLAPGDHVIMPTANQLGPVFHRFDTLIQPRSASAILIRPDR